MASARPRKGAPIGEPRHGGPTRVAAERSGVAAGASSSSPGPPSPQEEHEALTGLLAVAGAAHCAEGLKDCDAPKSDGCGMTDDAMVLLSLGVMGGAAAAPADARASVSPPAGVPTAVDNKQRSSLQPLSLEEVGRAHGLPAEDADPSHEAHDPELARISAASAHVLASSALRVVAADGRASSGSGGRASSLSGGGRLTPLVSASLFAPAQPQSPLIFSGSFSFPERPPSRLKRFSSAPGDEAACGGELGGGDVETEEGEGRESKRQRLMGSLPVQSSPTGRPAVGLPCLAPRVVTPSSALPPAGYAPIAVASLDDHLMIT